MQSVYLAGPEVFLPDAVEVGRRKQALCAAHGFAGLYPLDNEISTTSAERTDKLIYDANKAMMERADFCICNLTPFRGPGADVGTVFELGLMVGLGKKVFAYTNADADYVHRVEAFAPGSGKRLRDRHDMAIEDFGNFDNLMLEWAVRESSGHPIVRHAAGAADLYRDLSGFEQCLRLAAASMTSAAPVRR
jgi:nucleoside 2-deoxyribosyltransferase